MMPVRIAVCRPVGEPLTRNLKVIITPVAQFRHELSLAGKSFAKTVLGRKRVGRVQIKAEFTFSLKLVHVSLNTVSCRDSRCCKRPGHVGNKKERASGSTKK